VFGNSKWQIDPLHYLGVIQERVGAFDSARAICQWRPSWPVLRGDVEKLVARQGITKETGVRAHPAAPSGLFFPGRVEEAVRDGDLRGLQLRCGEARIANKEEGSADVLPWPKTDPGITDRRIEVSDVRRYGALLEGGVA
jgi:hypothetical protein